MEEALKPLLGVWKCDNARTENFEEFLTEMGSYSSHMLECGFHLPEQLSLATFYLD